MMVNLQKILGSAYDMFTPRERILYASLVLREGPPSTLEHMGIPPKDLVKDIFFRYGQKEYESGLKLKCVVTVADNVIKAEGENWKASIVHIPSQNTFTIRHNCDLLKARIKYGLPCSHIIAVFLNMDEKSLNKFITYLIKDPRWVASID
ncbi:MAG: hypothetical protein QXL15_05130 [Candidatus Korarchaeota archaeon]